MLYQGIEVKKMWDGYLTVTAKVAKAISLNGHIPKPGHENRTSLKVSDRFGGMVRVWVGRTFYGNEECYWLHPTP